MVRTRGASNSNKTDKSQGISRENLTVTINNVSAQNADYVQSVNSESEQQENSSDSIDKQNKTMDQSQEKAEQNSSCEPETVNSESSPTKELAQAGDKTPRNKKVGDEDHITLNADDERGVFGTPNVNSAKKNRNSNASPVKAKRRRHHSKKTQSPIYTESSSTSDDDTESSSSSSSSESENSDSESDDDIPHQKQKSMSNESNTMVIKDWDAFLDQNEKLIKRALRIKAKRKRREAEKTKRREKERRRKEKKKRRQLVDDHSGSNKSRGDQNQAITFNSPSEMTIKD